MDDLALLLQVLPASAGMILPLPVGFCVCVGAPRIRGDDPQESGGNPNAIKCSPHPRG